MTNDTAALVRQMRDALDDARDDVQVELVMCQQRAGYPSTDRELAYQIDLARRVDDAIAAADAWLAQQPTNQCGETCERAKLCAVCAMDAARDMPRNTCGASRHAQQIAEHLLTGQPVGAARADAIHAGESLAAVVSALWRVRTEHAQQAETIRVLRARLKETQVNEGPAT